MSTLLYASFVLLLASFWSASEACRCIAPNPNVPRWCNKDHLALVKIEGEQPSGDMHKLYQFKVLADESPMKTTTKLADFNYLRTGVQSAMCGVKLHINKTYLIAIPSRGSTKEGEKTLNIMTCGSYYQQWPETKSLSELATYANQCTQ